MQPYSDQSFFGTARSGNRTHQPNQRRYSLFGRKRKILYIQYGSLLLRTFSAASPIPNITSISSRLSIGFNPAATTIINTC